MIRGHFLYDGKHTISQVDDIEKYFNEFLTLEKFDTIIEIGTQMGGLIYLIDDIVKNLEGKSKIYTFDIGYRDYVDKECRNRGIDFICMDEYSDEFHVKITNLIEYGGRVLLLCDGGNKIYEFNKYSDTIKVGDFIMVHDYAFSDKVFNENIKNIIWNWCEVRYSDIESSATKNNLSKYNDVDFESAVWGCFTKLK